MDIARPSAARQRKIRRIIYGLVAAIVVVGVTLGLSRLKPRAPTVDGSVEWAQPVQRGNMLRQVRGLGTLVPEDIRWIPAQSAAKVDKILLRSGAQVRPDSIIMELSDPQLQSDAFTDEALYKQAQADYDALKAKLDSDLMTQKSTSAQVESLYQQAVTTLKYDQQMLEAGIGPQNKVDLDKVSVEQLAIQEKLSQQGLGVAVESDKAQLASGAEKVDSAKGLYELKHSQLDALHVRAGMNGILQCVCSSTGTTYTDVQVGQQVVLGTNLARVADPTRLKATVQIPETQAKDVLLNQKAEVDTRNGIVKGHVTRVAGAVVNGTVDVDISFDEPLPPSARPDLSVDGTITIENLTNVLYVGRPVHGEPNSTVGLFKVSPDGSEATRVQVKLGRASVNTMEVLSGLNEGDVVILSDMSNWDAVDRIELSPRVQGH
ncbi:MAG TPA: HlyD family efflux transporter periplasmic adaptor subunit [Candidatus Acidoferrales bacterium]|nr:HlyD family efflux transporter periplasmic adaptor subunit [Candidatus Acidoferrales bacterium]